MHSLARALHARVADPRRVDDYYAPLASACALRLAAHPQGTWVLGIQGPQGSGKTTLATALAGAFVDLGIRAVAVSIDDFYLPHEAQRALAAQHPGNPCLEHRGYPGTHDVALGAEVIARLKALRAGEATEVPVYDKSAHGGRGDRAPATAWRRVEGPVEMLILDGWLLGFSPVPESTLDTNLRAPNRYLEAYAAWNAQLDGLIQLDVESLETIIAWRVDAERARREHGEVALSDEDARDYITRFLPAYRAYVPRLKAHPPCEDFRSVLLGEDRYPRLRS
jgi:D-glycerate 3-kinase